jgi:D-alanyl-D-alanine carboxypeptidase
MKAARLLAILCAVLAVGLAPVPVHGEGGEEALVQQIEQILAAAYPSNQPGAAVLVQRGDRVLLRKGYGLADVEWGIPVDPATVFRIGSVTKQLTAAAVLRLVQEGKLSLDDPLTRFFPEAPAYLRAVRIEHLLTHTSGIPTYGTLPDYPRWSQLNVTPDWLVRRVLDEPLQFTPGAGWSYTDSGFYLLGLILEKVHGKSYEEVMREQIFEPLGMAHTFYDRGERIIPRQASGYAWWGGQLIHAPYQSMDLLAAAGALASTVDDLARWSAALDGDRLVRRDLLARAFTPYRLADGRSTYYGYAWAIGDYEGHTLVEHGGKISGFEAHILRVPDAGILVVLLTNATGRKPDPDFLATRIATYLLGKPYDPVAVPVSEAAAREYVGIYGDDERTRREVLLRDGRLWVRRGEAEPQEILSRGNDEFFAEGSFLEFRFERGESGAVVRMVLKPDYGAEIRAEKLTVSDTNQSSNARLPFSIFNRSFRPLTLLSQVPAGSRVNGHSVPTAAVDRVGRSTATMVPGTVLSVLSGDLKSTIRTPRRGRLTVKVALP